MSSAQPPELPARGPAVPARDPELPARDSAVPADGAIPADGANEVRGEEQVTVAGVTFRRGATLVLAPGVDRDPYDRMLDGRRATLERIYLDYDDRVYLGVTVDDDPGQQLMRETGRYLFFFAHEVRPVAPRESGAS